MRFGIPIRDTEFEALFALGILPATDKSRYAQYLRVGLISSTIVRDTLLLSRTANKMQTQFNGKLTASDLSDVRRMTRSKMYWPKLLATNLYGVLVLCVVTWATVAGLIGKSDPNWKALAFMWVVIAGIVWWAFYSSKKSIAKQSAPLNATLPDRVIIENSGVKLELPAGA